MDLNFTNKFMHLILTLLLLNFYPNLERGSTWGPTGHRVIAEVANNYLTNNSIEKINKILNGETLVNASTYADDILSLIHI